MIEPYETRTGRVWREADGIVRVLISAEAVQNLTDAKENLGAAIKAGLGTKSPLLVDIRQAKMLEPEARHYYAGNALDDHFTALGLLLNASPLGIMMGNVYMRLARHKVPLRLFQKEEDALAWLLKQRLHT